MRPYLFLICQIIALDSAVVKTFVWRIPNKCDASAQGSNQMKLTYRDGAVKKILNSQTARTKKRLADRMWALAK